MGLNLGKLNTSLGDVVKLNIFGQPTVILGSYQAAFDLLDHRGASFICSCEILK